jgi:hypothetical protein
MMLSNPGRLGLGDRIQTSCKALGRTLTTMDKSVDKAEMDPERFHVNAGELIDRYAAHLAWVMHCLERQQDCQSYLCDTLQL